METHEIASTEKLSGTSAMTLEKGTVLQDRYEILDLRALGGMGAIYRARDLRFAQTVRRCAIKEIVNIAPKPQTRRLNLQNFEREANILATLSHPAIPHIFDYFSLHDRAYLVMEYIEGQDLEAFLEESKEILSEERVMNWALQICDVLVYLHSHPEGPIVFRDIKPSNIMLRQDERIVLVDFGIAKIFMNEKKGTMVGTEGYSPPEQYRGVAGPRGDIYALGATLHHLLTGQDPRLRPPFSFHEALPREINPSVSADVEALVIKCLEYKPEDRFASAGELRQAIEKTLDEPTTTSSVVSASTERLGPSEKRLLWDFACEDEVRASPVLRGDILYIGAYDHNLYALDAQKGEFLWKYPTESGICTTPCLTKDKILFGSEDHQFYALGNRTGRLTWRFSTKGRVRSSALAAYGHVFFGSDDGCLYAINIDSGRVIWTFQSGGPIRCRPLLVDETLVFGSEDRQVYGIDMGSGDLRWKQRTSGGLISSPCLGEKLIYIGSKDWNLYAFSARSGWPVWRFRTDNAVISSPSFSQGRVFVGSADTNIYALAAENGRSIWRASTGGQVTSSPVVHQDAIYAGSVDHSVYCLDTQNGRERWRYQTNGPITSSPAIHGNKLFIGSMDGHVYALSLGSKKA
jgi:outer membrane protein assembly factor BamB